MVEQAAGFRNRTLDGSEVECVGFVAPGEDIDTCETYCFPGDSLVRRNDTEVPWQSEGT